MEKSLNYVLYFQLTEKLDRSYFILAEIFKQVGISLIPIQASEVNLLERSKKYHAIIVRRKILETVKAAEFKKRKLDLMMYTGRLVLHDFSSFSELPAPISLEKRGSYIFTQLPIDYKQAAMDVIVRYFEDKNQYDTWPGGKRAKLFESDKIKDA